MTAATAELSFVPGSKIPRALITRLIRITQRVMQTPDQNFIANRELNLNRFALPMLDNLMVIQRSLREYAELATKEEQASLVVDFSIFHNVHIDFQKRKVVFKNKGYISF